MTRATCVLVVDDNEGDQYLAARTLRKFDEALTILTAYDGEEALEVLEQAAKKPDIILLDLNMPRMDGIEFLEEYQRRAILPHTTIVVLSSSDLADDRSGTTVFDCVQHYVVKPLLTRHLPEILGGDSAH